MTTVGECIVTQLYDMEVDLSLRRGRLRIERADPRIWISEELLNHLDHPDVTLTGGDLLTIDAVNKRVIYRIDYGRSHPDLPSVIYAEWPD
jgi:hypothetical protein